MTYATKKQYPFIVTHEGIRDGHQHVMVQCPIERTSTEAIEFVEQKRGGTWLMAMWQVQEGEFKKDLSNPHRNTQGQWCWLLVEA